MDWSECLKGLGSDDFVYLDPPYFGTDVRSYSPRTVDFPALIQALKVARFKWVLSEYAHPMYLSAFGSPYAQRRVQVSVKVVNAAVKATDGDTHAVESIWRNF
jgi:site-specific DNA-adenine methylase